MIISADWAVGPVCRRLYLSGHVSSLPQKQSGDGAGGGGGGGKRGLMCVSSSSGFASVTA